MKLETSQRFTLHASRFTTCALLLCALSGSLTATPAPAATWGASYIPNVPLVTQDGPDLQGVTSRRDRAWLSQFLQAPNLMRAKKDPIAVALSAKFPGVLMPNLGLSETDVGDLLAYLDVKTARLAAPVVPFVNSEK